MQAIRSFLRGVFEAAGIAALIVAGGLSFAAVLGGGSLPTGAPAPYLWRAVDPRSIAAAPRVWLVDGYNVLNVGLLGERTRDGLARSREGWWTAPFRNELIGRVEAFDEDAAEIWVVFDGTTPPDPGGIGRVRSVFAPSADEWLLARIRERDPAQVALVTADRRLAARARDHGVEVVAPAAFLARCRAA
jgi:hypothetical protein